MSAKHIFSINTYDKRFPSNAKKYGFGLEIEAYIWDNRMKDAIQKREHVSALMDGFSSFSFHGTAVGRRVSEIVRLSDDELWEAYDTSYTLANYHGIDKIVFHANYFKDFESETAWFQRNLSFWKRFLEDKPSRFTVYLENFVDDTPEMLAKLCDTVNDPRFKICFDTGHAGCNSKRNLHEWISILGTCIGHVHLHDNDGVSDRHWPLGVGILDIAGALYALLALKSVDRIVLECDFEKSFEWLSENEFIII